MINIEVTGNRLAIDNLEEIGKKIGDLRPAFSDMSGAVTSELKSNFDARGALLGSAWQVRKRSYPWPILQKTGKMKGAWKDTITSFSLRIRNVASYAKYHNFGTTSLPVRKIVGISPKIIKIVVDTIKKYLLI